MDSTNPKELIGVKKVPLHLFPSAGLIAGAMAFEGGARKYGAYNWRRSRIRMSIYLDAILRHVLCQLDGEDLAEDSQLPHNGHIIACAAILEDAKAVGTLVDDRPDMGQAPELLEFHRKRLQSRS